MTALVVGLDVFRRRKGGTQHRVLGYAYSVAMLTMLVTALSIYRLTGSFNLLHGFAIVSSLQLGRGLYHAVARRPKGEWLAAHYLWMSWSYIGLCAALVAESAMRIVMPYVVDRYGGISFGWFWTIVGLVTFAVTYVGQLLIRRYQKVLKQFAR